MSDINNKVFFRRVLGVIAFTITLIFIFFNFSEFESILKTIFNAVKPFVFGMVMAFILNTIVVFFEDVVFKKPNEKFKNGKYWNKIRRPITITISILVLVAIASFVLFFIIPGLITSISNFATTAKETLPVYIAEFIEWLDDFIIRHDLNIDLDAIGDMFFANFSVTSLLSNFTKISTDVLNSIVSATVSVASVVITGFLVIVYSIYFLDDKERLLKSCRKLIFAFLPKKKANTFLMFLTFSSRTFSKYIKGQVTECLILGSLNFIGMLIIGLDYALLISSIVTLLALVPLLGAYISLGVGFILLLMVNPMDAVWFFIFLIVLQQFEGNVIYPKVMGSSIGLPEVWTLTSVMVVGSLFGIGGVLVGPPTFAVMYNLLRYYTNKKLKANSITPEILDGSEVNVLYKDLFDPEIPQQQIQEKSHVISDISKKIKANLKK
ncbi:MAG: AI-2E family transporter [Clostridia bacterium]